ncbi:aldo/keto reductase [Natronomonas sp. EA1]|uniref:aldo/keto reductase n=1 Tax=Natronomonas sp. EA1 TaxID=3421655 RepID=UPI003EBA7D5A
MTQDERQQTARRINRMPTLGLGTWKNDDQSQCAESVQTALETGYRHIDTAQIYRNEEGVGKGIAAADVPREDVFLATKVWISSLDEEGVTETTKESLDRLDTDYLDLLYVHWPSRTYDAEETLTAFKDLKNAGHIERIGVSNFEPEHLDEAREVIGDDVFANQVEMHPLLQQEALREYCSEHDIELVAYSPLARGEVFDVPELTEVAEKHEVSEAQVSLAWLREKGVTPIPKATSAAHIEDNWAARDLTLDTEDVALIDSIEREERQIDPDFAPESW